MIWLNAADGGESRGLLYERGGERSVVLIAHPKASFLRHYLVPYLIDAGYAVFVQECRYLNNDTHCIHEKLVLDVAAAIRWARHEGYQSVVALGNSGGGSLLAFYQAQAEAPAGRRVIDTPAGDPCDLNAYELSPFDGLIICGAHLGEGLFMLEQIDPSVVEETNPALVDATLDMYDPANGYRGPDESATYSTDFVERYRLAQRARVARIDALARAHVSQQRLLAAAAENASGRERVRLLQQSSLARTMVIYRTESDLRACDLSLDRSARDLGSMESLRPDLTNYWDTGHARVMSPRGWLSTWSGLSSRASLPSALPSISVPTLFVFYSADNGIFPSAAEACLAAARMSDKTHLTIDLDHCGRPVRGSSDRGGREKAGNVISAWLKERYPN
jgi:pimeloyl-ACP methyl ester carboxylesterase